MALRFIKISILKQRVWGLLSFLLVPVLTVTAGTNTSAPDTGYIESIITGVQTIVNTLVPLLIAIALLLFIWGLVTYIFNSGDEAAKEEGKRKMIWGVITLFVIVSVWGLVALLNEITNVQQGEQVDTPEVPGAPAP